MRDEGDVSAGAFADTTLSHLLVRALDRRFTGTLAIEPPPDSVATPALPRPSLGPHLLHFERGLVARVLVPDGYARLGELLVESGIILEPELELALGRGAPLGKALIDTGQLEETALLRALVLQSLRRVVRLFAFPAESLWSFRDDVEAFAALPGPPPRIDTLRVLWSGLSAHGEQAGRLEAALARIGDAPFALRPELKLARFGLDRDTGAAASWLLEGATTLPELIAQGLAPAEHCQRLVYLLAITRYLHFAPVGEDTLGDGPASSQPDLQPLDRQERPSQPQRVGRIRLRRVALRRAAAPDAPGAGEVRRAGPAEPYQAIVDESSGEFEALYLRAASRLAAIERESAYELLEIDPSSLAGLPDEAATEVLWAAYEAVSRYWHPDNYPVELYGPEPPEELLALRERLHKIHEAITEAFVTLADPRKRAALAGPLAPDEPPRSASEPKSPRELHERALYLLAHDRPVEAQELCDAACQAAPEQPDYATTAVWIRTYLPRPDLKVLALDLDDILREHGDHVAARYYRGVIRRRLGHDAAAQQDFERVLVLDPAHAAATAQLRELAHGASSHGRRRA